MSIFSFIGGLFEPATKLVDEIFTTDEERNLHKEKVLEVKTVLAKIQTDVIDKVLDYESKIADAQSKIIIAEAQGQSFLQRNWRPILMLVIVAFRYNTREIDDTNRFNTVLNLCEGRLTYEELVRN